MARLRAHPRRGTVDAARIEALEAAVADLTAENTRLRRIATTDPLTGASNREFLNQRLPEAIDRATRRGEPLSIAMIDIDHFKKVNDTHGHLAGDQVLKAVAARIRNALGADDQLVRYGGEEFIVLLPGTDTATAARVAERLRARLADEPIEVEGALLQVHISTGVAGHRAGAGEDAVSLIGRADRALYAAKDGGRNRVEVAP